MELLPSLSNSSGILYRQSQDCQSPPPPPPWWSSLRQPTNYIPHIAHVKQRRAGWNSCVRVLELQKHTTRSGCLSEKNEKVKAFLAMQESLDCQKLFHHSDGLRSCLHDPLVWRSFSLLLLLQTQHLYLSLFAWCGCAEDDAPKQPHRHHFQTWKERWTKASRCHSVQQLPQSAIPNVQGL